MAEINRQALKDVAEAVGFAAIIISLILVAVETRDALPGRAKALPG